MTATAPSTGRLVLILGTLTAFAPLAIDMYLPALPTIAQEFGTDTAAVQRTLAVFFIALAFGQVVYGPVADRIGRRPPLLFGFALFTLASAACALAPTLDALVLARLLQALGGCAGMVVARSVVRDCFAPQDSARIFSLLLLVLGVAPILAPLIGGQLLGIVGWRSIFWLLAGFGLICLGLVLWALPETLPPERRVRDGLGAVLPTYGRLLRDRQFVGYALTGGLVSAAMFAYIAGSPFVLIELFGVPPERYGWIFGANALGLIGAAQLNRLLLARMASVRIVWWALGAAALSGLLLVAAAASGAGGLAGLLPPLFLCVASGGLVGPNTAAAALAPHGRDAGSASALLGALQFGLGTLAATSVELFHNGTAVPMAATVAGCALLALACLRLAIVPAPAALAERPATPAD